MKFLSSLAAASVAALFFSLTALAWIYGPRLLTHLDGVLTRAEGVESKAYATLNNVDKASKTWADASQQEANDVADTMLQVRGTLSGAQDAFASIPPVAQHLEGTADAATSTLGAVHGATDALTVNLQHLTPLEDGILPIESRIDATTGDLDAFIKSEAVTGTAKNLAELTGNANGIAADARKVTDKLTEDFTAKKPWYRRIGPSLEDVWDYGALVARHTP